MLAGTIPSARVEAFLTSDELPEDAWAALLGAGEERRYRRGAWIFVEGDPPGPALAVIEGEVRVEAMLRVPRSSSSRSRAACRRERSSCST